MAEGNSAPESVILNPEVTDPSSAVDKSQNTGKVTRRSFIAGGLAAIAGLFGRKASGAEAATPQQNMVASTEDIRSKDFAAGQERVQDRGSKMAHDQEDTTSKDFAGNAERVQDTPQQNMVTSTEEIRQEPGEKMADATLDIKSKDFAAGQERVQDKGSEMAHDQEDTTSKDFAGNAERVQDEDNSGGDDSNTETPSPEIPPADEALV